MIKKLLLLGAVSGLLAGLVSWEFSRLYIKLLAVDYSSVVTPVKIILSSLVGALVAALGYWVLYRFLKTKTELVFNLLYTILSLTSMIGVFATKLPLEVDRPEFFPWLMLPMHIFLPLGWMTLRPFFFSARVD